MTLRIMHQAILVVSGFYDSSTGRGRRPCSLRELQLPAEGRVVGACGAEPELVQKARSVFCLSVNPNVKTRLTGRRSGKRWQASSEDL